MKVPGQSHALQPPHLAEREMQVSGSGWLWTVSWRGGHCSSQTGGRGCGAERHKQLEVRGINAGGGVLR